MESVNDYYRKKEIFKPQILEWMKKMKYHYVHKVSLEDNPYIGNWENKNCRVYYHFYALNVRGCRLPNAL